MAWTDGLAAQSGDFTAILSMLTQVNGVALEAIYSELEDWCLATSSEPIPGVIDVPINSLNDLIATDTCLAIETPLATESAIATLTGLGLLRKNGAHLAPTALGIEFLEAVKAQP